MAGEAKHKEEVVDEVEVEETVKEKVKGGRVRYSGEGESNKGEGGGWQRTLLGGGGHHGVAMGPCRPKWPAPPKPRRPPLGPPAKSNLDSAFFYVPCAPQNFVAGEVGMGA